jgi:hypothetical protein
MRLFTNRGKLALKYAVAISLPIFLISCSDALRTHEGVPRKAVVSNKDGATLYKSSDLDKKMGEAEQWDIFFILEKKGEYYKVTTSLDSKSNEPLYIKASDAFEWNLPFCIAYKNSPHIAKRPITKIYRSVEGLKSKDESNLAMQEKETHSSNFNPKNVDPVLKEVDSDSHIYYIASLYDRRQLNGTYKFFGDYDFGYVRYEPQAHRYYRYVNRRQFQDNINGILRARNSSAESQLNPESLDDVFDGLISLINPDGTTQDGVKGVKRVFSGADSPSGIEKGVFHKESLRGQNGAALNEKLNTMYDEMVSYLEDGSKWNEHGYSYVPLEWMND